VLDERAVGVGVGARGVARIFAVAHTLGAFAIIGASSPLTKRGRKWAEQQQIGTQRD
jgi:hypothetical protein